MDGELLAKPSKDKLQSVRPRACCMGSAGFGPPRLAGKRKKVMSEEGWGRGITGWASGWLLSVISTNFKRKRSKTTPEIMFSDRSMFGLDVFVGFVCLKKTKQQNTSALQPGWK